MFFVANLSVFTCKCDVIGGSIVYSLLSTMSVSASLCLQLLAVERRCARELIADAKSHNSQREVERHRGSVRRIEQLLAELGEPAEQGAFLHSPCPKRVVQELSFSSGLLHLFLGCLPENLLSTGQHELL